jgi:hypothetical protein
MIIQALLPIKLVVQIFTFFFQINVNSYKLLFNKSFLHPISKEKNCIFNDIYLDSI